MANEWILGQPVEVDVDQFEWVLGTSLVIIEEDEELVNTMMFGCTF